MPRQNLVHTPRRAPRPPSEPACIASQSGWACVGRMGGCSRTLPAPGGGVKALPLFFFSPPESAASCGAAPGRGGLRRAPRHARMCLRLHRIPWIRCELSGRGRGRRSWWGERGGCRREMRARRVRAASVVCTVGVVITVFFLAGGSKSRPVCRARCLKTPNPHTHTALPCPHPSISQIAIAVGAHTH